MVEGQPTYVAVSEHLLHVDALCVENRLFLPGLCCGFTQQAARQASGLHDDGVVGQSRQDCRHVEVHLAHRHDQVHLRAGLKD